MCNSGGAFDCCELSRRIKAVILPVEKNTFLL